MCQMLWLCLVTLSICYSFFFSFFGSLSRCYSNICFWSNISNYLLVWSEILHKLHSHYMELLLYPSPVHHHADVIFNIWRSKFIWFLMRLVNQVSDTEDNLIPSHQNLVLEIRIIYNHESKPSCYHCIYLATKHIVIDFPSSILSAQILLSFQLVLQLFWIATLSIHSYPSEFPTIALC